jgi:hypothetical protein
MTSAPKNDYPLHRLVVRSLPCPDECLHGWLVRLAEANGYTVAKSIRRLITTSGPCGMAGSLAELVDGLPSEFERYVIKEKNCIYTAVSWAYLASISARNERCVQSVWPREQ